MESIPGALFVVTGYTRLQRSHDNAHRFEQESNFWYLCGISEPDWQMIIDGAQNQAWLVAPKIAASHALFDGSLAFAEAKALSGVSSVLNLDEADRLLRKLQKKHPVVYTVSQPAYADHFNFSLNPAQSKLQQKLERIFQSVQFCNSHITKLRAIKQPTEIRMIEKAIAITNTALLKIKNDLKNYKTEYEIEAALSYEFRRSGSSGHAYDPIVAAGKNACTLHYIQNDSPLRKRQMVLLDVGARWKGYAADITRTYAYGEPTKRQVAVHKAVHHAQAEIIDQLQPGISVERYQSEVTRIMATALTSLGLTSSLNDEKLHRYFPHAVSHGLGIDVHDELGRPREFTPGMVLTVEPGIYIPEESIGVRLEDDVLITDKGHRNLSGHLSTDW